MGRDRVGGGGGACCPSVREEWIFRGLTDVELYEIRWGGNPRCFAGEGPQSQVRSRQRFLEAIEEGESGEPRLRWRFLHLGENAHDPRRDLDFVAAATSEAPTSVRGLLRFDERERRVEILGLDETRHGQQQKNEYRVCRFHSGPPFKTRVRGTRR